MKPWHRFENRKSSTLWLLVFSDMSTNLMLFFLMLFAMTRMTEFQKQAVREGMERAVIGKEQSMKKRVQRELEEKAAIRKLEDALTYGSLKDYAGMEVYKTAIKITLKDPVLFALGSARLNAGALKSLETLVGPLREFPNDIVIDGHTDNVPIKGSIYPSNWELSVARAVSVIDYMAARGLDARKLVAAGYGEYHPVVPNDTEEGRARNRRIEITIVRQSRAGK